MRIIDDLQAIRNSIANPDEPFDIWNPTICIGGHAKKLFGFQNSDTSYYVMKKFGLTTREAHNLVYPGGSEGDRLPPKTPISREDALRMMDRIIAGGTVKWTEVLGVWA
jgi:hypothetical protein